MNTLRIQTASETVLPEDSHQYGFA